ncbi:MAG: MFS transporter [Streptosporangiales bacterium]
MRRLLAHRDARIYLAGQFLSTLGDSALWLAMGIWVKLLTGSSSAAGLVFFAFICGTCLGPLTGVITDRVRRRPLLITANLATGALVCLLLLVGGRSGVWLVYVVMFGYGVSYSLLSSAQTALLPALVPADLLGAANSALQTVGQGLRIVTPLLGAGLLAWLGPAPVIVVDAASFAAAAGAVTLLRVREPGRPAAGAPGGARWRTELAAGLRHIGSVPSLRRLAIAGIIAASVFGFFETVEFAVVSDGLHRSPPFLGVLAMTQGAGGVLAGLLAAPVMARAGARTLITGGLLACAVGCAFEASAALALVIPGAALVGGCIVWINIGAITLIQHQTPGHLLGRVDAAVNTVVTVPQAASIAAGAAALAVAGYRVLLAVMTAVLLAAAAYLARGPKVRPAPSAVDTGGNQQSSAGIDTMQPGVR